MTGRELILYILSNGLENEPVFKDGKFIGFMTEEEARESIKETYVYYYSSFEWIDKE